MESFDYKAINSTGQRVNGTIMAANRREARIYLSQRTLTPTHIKTTKTRLHRQRFRFRPRHKDITLASRQLAILIDAATPVEDALKVSALQFERSPMRDVLLDIRTRVMEGHKLSDGLRAYPHIFSPLFTAMVTSGENSGQLAHALERIAVDFEAAQKIRQKILAATIYPIILCIVALIVTTVMLVFIVPKVVTQFDTFGQALPPLTRFVMALSSGIQNYGLIGLITVLLLSLGLYRLFQSPHIKQRLHGFVLKLPILGPLNRNLNAARFCRTLAGLLESGTQMINALDIAAHTLRNQRMREALATATVKVQEGASLSQALGQSEVFPALVKQMIIGGEVSGNMAQMFTKAADYLESEFETATAIFLNLLEPLIIILLALVVLLIIAAIFLPILQLNTLAF